MAVTTKTRVKKEQYPANSTIVSKRSEQHPCGAKGEKRNKKVFIFLAVAICLLLNASAAYALPGGLGSIETKASDVRDLCMAVAAIIVVIGAIWSGVKFIKGDPDSWGYVWKFALGAIIVYAAPEMVIWLST